MPALGRRGDAAAGLPRLGRRRVPRWRGGRGWCWGCVLRAGIGRGGVVAGGCGGLGCFAGGGGCGLRGARACSGALTAATEDVGLRESAWLGERFNCGV